MSDIILKGEKAKLLKKGVALKQKIKDNTEALEKIKKELNLSEIGTYTNKNGDKLKITSVTGYSEIDPFLVFKHMKKNSMKKNFWKCVKVQLTELKKHVPEKKIEKWRKKLNDTSRWTWMV